MDQRIIEAACERAMKHEFEWGHDDCCLWVCDIIEEATGLDLAAPLRGYHSCFGAARRLKTFAGGGLIEAAIKLAALARLKPAGRPWRGDLVGIVMSPNRPSLAVFWRGRWVARSQTGVVYLPATAGIMAWKLP